MPIAETFRYATGARGWVEVALVVGDRSFASRAPFADGEAAVTIAFPSLTLATDTVIELLAYGDSAEDSSFHSGRLELTIDDDVAVTPHRMVSESDVPDGTSISAMLLTPTRLPIYGGDDDSDGDIVRDSDGLHTVAADIRASGVLTARFTRAEVS